MKALSDGAKWAVPVVLVVAFGLVLGIPLVYLNWAGLPHEQAGLDVLIGQAILIELTLAGFALVAAGLVLVGGQQVHPSDAPRFASNLGRLWATALMSVLLNWYLELWGATAHPWGREQAFALTAGLLIATVIFAGATTSGILGYLGKPVSKSD